MYRFIHQISTTLLLIVSCHVGAAGLSTDEVAQATALAQTYPWDVVDQRRRRPADQNGLGVQLLSVEVAEQKNQSGNRRALVYQFDHETQSARRLDIDMDSNQVVQEMMLQSVHLPLNQNEIDSAISLLGNSALFERLRDEQRLRGHMPFSSLDELSVKAVVFEPFDQDHICHVERCALLSLFDKTRTVFTIEPIVHYASGDVMVIGDW